MQPGLSRAVPMAIIGFMFGALIVIILRGLQGLDPIWSAGSGIITSAIFMAVFFIWGMGAFDPKMSVHGEHAEVVPEEPEKPRSVLFGSIWQIATIVIVLSIVLGGFAALPGGLALTQTIEPGASLTRVGYAQIPLPFGGPEIEVSTLVIFAVFVIWAFISLALVAWVIGFIFTYLARGVTEVQTAGGGTAALTAGSAPRRPATTRDRLRTIITFVITFIILYLLFYYVAIGLILPAPDLPGLNILFPSPATQLMVISAINAAIFTLLILRTQLVLHTIGRVAGWLARLLRRIPSLLFQR